MLGGKGEVGKTSCAASIAVKFANNGHPTLVVSTDPAYSLSDSFAQHLTGETLVPVEGPYSPLFALEINPEKAREEYRSASQKSGGAGIKDFMDGVDLGVLVEQLGELKLESCWTHLLKVLPAIFVPLPLMLSEIGFVLTDAVVRRLNLPVMLINMYDNFNESYKKVAA